jgi:hypothetical protein
VAGCDTAEITRRAGISKPSVWHRQERFTREGVAGLLRDKTRKPGLPPLLPAQIEPPGEATHWTGRAMAAASGLSMRSVQRIWAAHRLQPHRVRRFKLSQDPACAAKLRDVVGLYLTRRPTALRCESTRSRASKRSTAPSRAWG